MINPGDFQKLTKEHGGARSEAFWTLSDEQIDATFHSFGAPGLNEVVDDPEDHYPPEHLSSHTWREIEEFPPEAKFELDTVMWCEDIPETVAWLTTKTSDLTSTSFGEENVLDDVGDNLMFNQIMRHPILRPMAEQAME